MKLLVLVPACIALVCAPLGAAALDSTPPASSDVRRFQDLPPEAQSALLNLRQEASSGPYGCYGLTSERFQQALGALFATDYNGDGRPDFLFRSPCRPPDSLDGRLPPGAILLSAAAGYSVGERFNATLGFSGGQPALLVDTPCAEDPGERCYLGRLWNPATRAWTEVQPLRIGPDGALQSEPPPALPAPPPQAVAVATLPPPPPPAKPPPTAKADPPKQVAEKPRTPATHPPSPPPPAGAKLAMAAPKPAAPTAAPASTTVSASPATPPAAPAAKPPEPAPPRPAAPTPGRTPYLKNEVSIAQPVRPQPRAAGDREAVLPVSAIKPLRDQVVVATTDETAIIVVGGPYEKAGVRTLRVMQLASPKEGQTIFAATIDLLVADEELAIDCAAKRFRVSSAINDKLLGRNPVRGQPKDWIAPEASWEKLYLDYACYGVQPYTVYVEGSQYPSAIARYEQYAGAALARNKKIHDSPLTP